MSIAWGPTRQTSSARINARREATVAQSSSQGSEPWESPVLDIHVAGRGIAKLDRTSQSDPMCIMYVPVNGWQEFGRTEVIYDNPNPSWVRTFQAAYIFEIEQPIRFAVADVDSGDSSLREHDLVGTCETTIQNLVVNRGHETVLELTSTRHRGPRGQLVINVEECLRYGVQGEFSGRITARDLRKVRTFSRDWPFFQIEKAAESGGTLPVYRSEILPKCYGGSWRPFVIPLDRLCQGDLAVPITISFWDQKGSQEPVPLGSVQMSVQALIDHRDEPLTIRGTKGKPAMMRLTGGQLRQRRTLYGYLEQGLQMNLVTAIDFTISNNEPERPYSLHYTGACGFNQYQTCIQAVGSIICPYDSDQLFPCYGFGGKIGSETSHCFPLNDNEAEPSVHGLDGIQAVYCAAIRAVKLSTPTYFAPVIRKATEIAAAA